MDGCGSSQGREFLLLQTESTHVVGGTHSRTLQIILPKPPLTLVLTPNSKILVYTANSKTIGREDR